MVWIAILFLSSAIVNSFGDALKFSGATQAMWADFVWHCIKYFIQIPLWMLTGYKTFDYIVDHELIDFWHPQWDHLYLSLILIGSVITWQVVYQVSVFYLKLYGAL